MFTDSLNRDLGISFTTDKPNCEVLGARRTVFICQVPLCGLDQGLKKNNNKKQEHGLGTFILPCLIYFALSDIVCRLMWYGMGRSRVVSPVSCFAPESFRP